MKTRYPSIGSVSSATMRPEDLIPCFLDQLALLASVADTIRTPEQERVAELICAIEGRIDHAEDYYESEESDFDLEELFNELDNFAPPYCHFGAHEGDGADYGFWISFESLEDDCRYGEVVKVPAGDEWPELDDDCEYVCEVNEHGNMTLYDRDQNEIWSCV